jgi:hypothetical protein
MHPTAVPCWCAAVQARTAAKGVIEQQLSAVEQQLQASKFLVRHNDSLYQLGSHAVERSPEGDPVLL